MKRKVVERIVNLTIIVHKEADVQKAVTQIHLAAGKASKGGRVEIKIQLPEELAQGNQDRLAQGNQDRLEPERPAKQPSADQKPSLVDPGSQNPPPAEQPEVPELVQKAQEKLAKGKIPNAKERKALEDWEARQ